MSNSPSNPFSSGTEYEVFKYNFCERCKEHKLNEDGFPAFPEKGGCSIEDAMENARFDISVFPSENIRELRDANDDSIICWHYCNRFHSEDKKTQFEYFDLMKRAICKDKNGE